jgi:hypothetical protein
VTVYVDDFRVPARVGRLGARWSHLTADTTAELHAFAARLGLRRSWFQDVAGGRWHYDVTESKRRAAVRLGAVEVPWRELGRVWAREGREGRPPAFPAGDVCAEVARVCAGPEVGSAVMTVAADPARPGVAWVRLCSRRHADAVVAELVRAGFAVDPPSVRGVDTGPEPTLAVARLDPALDRPRAEGSVGMRQGRRRLERPACGMAAEFLRQRRGGGAGMSERPAREREPGHG